MICHPLPAVVTRFVLAIGLIIDPGSALAMASTDVVPRPCEAFPIPVSMRQYLTTKYPSWRIVDLPDLSDDRRGLWVKGEGVTCPGIAAGHFQYADRLSYAVLLAQSRGSNEYVTLIVISDSPKGLSVVTVEKPVEMGPKRHVIFKGPPGTYREFDGPRVLKTDLEVIVHKWLEAGTVVYVWNGKRFVEVVVWE